MRETIRDAHTHFFSRTFFEALARLAPGDAPVEARLCELAERSGIELPPSDHLLLQERWFGAMDAAGVDSLVTFASLPEEADVVASACASSAGRLTGYVVANAGDPRSAPFLERALGELGLRGVVLFPALHHYSLSDRACRPALDVIQARRAVCVVHCGVLKVKLRDLLGIPRSYDARFASPLDVVAAAGAYPDVTFVVPHFGAGMFRELLLLGSWCENVCVDTSSSNEWLSTQVPRLELTQAFERALEVFGPRRLLYGSDSSTFPRGYRSDVLAQQLAALDALHVVGEERASILGGNLERLLARTA